MANIRNKYFPAQSSQFQDVNTSASNDPLETKPAATTIDTSLLTPLATIRQAPGTTGDIPSDPTTYNPYFDTNGIQRGSAVQQQVVQQMHAETINQQGLSITYYPFEEGTVDGVWNEDPTVTYPNSFEVDMYLETYEGFEGDGKILTQYGVQFRDQMTMLVAINTWKSRRDNYIIVQGDSANLTETSEPREGDLISVPFGLNAINPEVYSPKLFQINNVTTFRDGAFFQLGNVYIYRITATLYERSAEDIIASDPATGAAKSADDSLTQLNSNTQDISIEVSPYNNAAEYAIGARVIFDGKVYTTAEAQVASSPQPGAVGSTWTEETTTTGLTSQINVPNNSILSGRLPISAIADQLPATHQITIPSVTNLNSLVSITHFVNDELTDPLDLGVLNNNDFTLIRDNTNTPTGQIIFNMDQFDSSNVAITVDAGFLQVRYLENNKTVEVPTTIVETDPFATNTELENADDEIAVDDFTQMRWGQGTDAFGGK